jgi:DNA-binding NarL/FixJ family response regulator
VNYRDVPDPPRGDTPPGDSGKRAERVVRLAVVAEVRLYRMGLTSVLSRCPEFDLVGSAGSLDETLDLLHRKAPDVIVLDMGATKSHDIVREIRCTAPEVEVVAYAVEESEQHILACARAGVSAFVPREGSERDLVEVIRALSRGELSCSGRSAAILFAQLQQMADREPTSPDLSVLTLREREVLGCIDRGMANKEIARELGIEVATVKNHVHKILDKLRVPSRARAAALLRDSA